MTKKSSVFDRYTSLCLFAVFVFRRVWDYRHESNCSFKHDFGALFVGITVMSVVCSGQFVGGFAGW